jgi:hypothetical protein
MRAMMRRLSVLGDVARSWSQGLRFVNSDSDGARAELDAVGFAVALGRTGGDPRRVSDDSSHSPATRTIAAAPNGSSGNSDLTRT